MDKVTKQNEKTWDKLVENDVPCSRPSLKLTVKQAQESVDPNHIFGNLKGKNVLCLASGGGHQSICFVLLGANVTVVDFSQKQLEKDELVAKKFGISIRIIKSDMRDLSMFKTNEFDVVYQPYSINYIPETNKIFDEVARVTKSGGFYHLMFHNPFVHGSWISGCWGGEWKVDDLWHGVGYPLWQPYKDGYKIKTFDPNWDFETNKGKKVKIKSPQEFKHTLSTVFNGLINRGFNIIKFEEYRKNGNYKPGTWEHYVSCCAPWLFLWAQKN